MKKSTRHVTEYGTAQLNFSNDDQVLLSYVVGFIPKYREVSKKKRDVMLEIVNFNSY
jgi:hypothetical protein